MIDKYKKQLQDLFSKGGFEIQQLETLQNTGFKPNSIYIEYLENMVGKSYTKGIIISSPNNLVKIKQTLFGEKDILLNNINYDIHNGNTMTINFMHCYKRAELKTQHNKIETINII